MTLKNIRSLMLLITVCVASYFQSNGQVAAFSQFTRAPFFTNPASIAMQESLSFSLLYRKMNLQQGVGLSIPALSVISPVRYKSTTKRKRNSFGAYSVTVLQQRAGTNGVFVTTGLTGGFAYKLNLDGKNIVSAGLQSTFYNFNIDQSRITTDNQFQNGYDPGLPTGENFISSPSSRFQVNAGVNWHSLDKQKQNLHWLGVGMFNINRPSPSFLKNKSNNEKFPVLMVVSGGYNFRNIGLGSVVLTPSFRYTRQAAVSLFNGGVEAGYAYDKQTKNRLSVGTYYCSNSSMVGYVGAQISKLYISLGYNQSFLGGREAASLSAAESVIMLTIP